MSGEIQLLDKALAILDLIGRAGACSLTRVADELGLPFSTAHRIAQALVGHGYVIRRGRGRYSLGTTILSLAAATTLRRILTGIARPILADLARHCRLCVHLGVLEDDMVTYLVKRNFGRQQIFSAEGMQLEAYCSAIGKVLLAHQSEQRRAGYLAAGDFVALTPRTIVDPAAMRAELALVRLRGWAIDDEEILPGLRCVAVPVADGNGTICAAVSVSSPVDRLGDARIEEILPAMWRASRLITRTAFPKVAPDEIIRKLG
jgi:DNA-binding IclR family transcriptional regulator